jgi:hypothetical protein
LIVPLDGLLKKVRRKALVVAGNVRVVAEHGRRVHGEPGQHANVLAVRRSLEPQQGQRLVDVVGVLRPLRLGVSEIRVRAAVDVGLRDVRGAKVEIPLRRSVSHSFR